MRSPPLVPAIALVLAAAPAAAAVAPRAPLPTPPPRPAPTPPPPLDVAPSPEGPVSATATSRFGLATGLLEVTESYPLGGIGLRQALVPGFNLVVAGHGTNGWPLDGPADWSWYPPGPDGRLELGVLSYEFADLTQPAVAHRRQDWSGTADLTRRLQLGPLGLDLGVGYMGRAVVASQDLASPPPTAAFATRQVFHGPQAVGRLDLDLWRSKAADQERRVALGFEGSLAPMVWGSSDVGPAPWPALSGSQVGGYIEVVLGTARLRLGLRQRNLWGEGYASTLAGPMFVFDFADRP